MRLKHWLMAAVAATALVVVVVILWLDSADGGTDSGAEDAAGRADQPYSTGVTKEPQGPTVTPTAGPNATLPAAKAGSSGCAAMDGVLARLLADTAEGRAFTRAVAGPGAAAAGQRDTSKEWLAFLRLVGAHKGDFAAAAGSDADAKGVLADLQTVVDLQPRLLDGSIPKYADMADAQQRAGAGLEPQPQPAYEQASAKLSQALDRVSWCMPTWPVVF